MLQSGLHLAVVRKIYVLNTEIHLSEENKLKRHSEKMDYDEKYLSNSKRNQSNLE